MKELSPELLEKAKAAKSVKELQEIASNNGFMLTEEDAGHYFNVLNPVEGEVSDNELEGVAGGCNDGSCNAYCGSLNIK